MVHRLVRCKICLRLDREKTVHGRPYCPERKMHMDPDLPRWCVAFKDLKQMILTGEEAEPRD